MWTHQHARSIPSVDLPRKIRRLRIVSHRSTSSNNSVWWGQYSIWPHCHLGLTKWNHSQNGKTTSCLQGLRSPKNRPGRGITNKEEKPRVSRPPRVPGFRPLATSTLPEPLWDKASTILPVTQKTKTPRLLPLGASTKVLTRVAKDVHCLQPAKDPIVNKPLIIKLLSHLSFPPWLCSKTPSYLHLLGRETSPLIYSEVALAISSQLYFLCSSLLDWPEDLPIYWLFFTHV